MSQQQYIPIDNKYTLIYKNLVESRQNMGRVFTTHCGYERHHIIPKSLGGSDRKENIVILTPREHCIAHMLLVRMYEGLAKAKMIFALRSMTRLRNKHRNTITTRLYETIRNDYQNRIKDPSVIAYRSEITRKQWTPERKKAVAEKTRKQWEEGSKRQTFASKEYKEKKCQQMKERWQDPEYRQWQREITIQQWRDNPPRRPC